MFFYVEGDTFLLLLSKMLVSVWFVMYTVENLVMVIHVHSLCERHVVRRVKFKFCEEHNLCTLMIQVWKACHVFDGYKLETVWTEWVKAKVLYIVFYAWKAQHVHLSWPATSARVCQGLNLQALFSM